MRSIHLAQNRESIAEVLKRTRYTKRIIVALGLSWTIVSQVMAFPLTDSDPNSPEFRQRFIGSYGVLADVEPKLSQADRPLYESIAPYLQSNPRYAIQQVEKKITNKSNAAFDFLLGNLYYSIQEYDSSRTALRTAIRKFPSFRRAYRTLALIEVQRGQLNASIPLWLKVITLGGGDAQSYGLLAYAYLREEKYRSALTAYTMARMFNPDSEDFKRGEAQCLLMTENYAGAIALFDDLIADAPSNGEYWLFQANAFLSEKHPDKAIANLEIAHDLGNATWQSLSLLGDLYLSRNNWNLAVVTYQEAVNQHPSTPVDKALNPLRSLLKIGLYQEAQTYMQTFNTIFAEKLKLEHQVEHRLMVIRINLGLGKTIEARKQLLEILDTDPLNGDALILLGNYEKEQGNLAAAELHLERASHLPDFRAEAWENLGKLFIERRDLKQAIYYFEKAYALTQAGYLKDYLKRLKNAVDA